WLIRHTAVRRAIGPIGRVLGAAESKTWTTWVTDGPPAIMRRKLQQPLGCDLGMDGTHSGHDRLRRIHGHARRHGSGSNALTLELIALGPPSRSIPKGVVVVKAPTGPDPAVSPAAPVYLREYRVPGASQYRANSRSGRASKPHRPARL